MAARNIIECNGPNCGAVRKETNGWWVILVWHEVFSIRHHDPDKKLEKDEKTVCGQACATRLLQSYMNIPKKILD